MIYYSLLCYITVVAQISEMRGVSVDSEKVNYFGTTHHVILQFNTGMKLGITETFTFGNTRYK